MLQRAAVNTDGSARGDSRTTKLMSVMQMLESRHMLALDAVHDCTSCCRAAGATRWDRANARGKFRATPGADDLRCSTCLLRVRLLYTSTALLSNSAAVSLLSNVWWTSSLSSWHPSLPCQKLASFAALSWIVVACEVRCLARCKQQKEFCIVVVRTPQLTASQMTAVSLIVLPARRTSCA